MPTRFIDPSLLRKAFDLIAPPAASPKQYLRWKLLAARIGRGEHWIRKRYQGRDRSELELTSLNRILKALEAVHRVAPDAAVNGLIELLSASDSGSHLNHFAFPRAASHRAPLRLRVVNVGFVRSCNANYCQRLEAGIRFGMLNGLRMSHLIDDESIDLGAIAGDSARLAAIGGQLRQFNEDQRYVERSYIVPIGTVATTAVSKLLERDGKLRGRLGKDLRVIFAGVTEPDITGILRFNRDSIGGMFAGSTFADRLEFISGAFPDRKIAFLYDPQLPQEIVARDHICRWRDGAVQLIEVHRHHPTRLPVSARHCLVTGYTVINSRIRELVRAHPKTAFIGVNTSDLGRGAVLSTGNNDLLFGIDCAERLLVPDCRNEINLRDMDIIRPDPVYGINHRACSLHGLIATMAARNKCRVIVD